MPHRVVWTPSARRALHELPTKAGPAVVELIYGPLAEAPRRVGKPLRLELEGRWSARRGDYRVIYQVSDHPPTVTIEAVPHRRLVYGRRGRSGR